MLCKVVLASVLGVRVSAAVNEQALSLLQVGSAVVDARGMELPNVSDVLAGATQVYTGMDKKAQKLEALLEHLQQQGAAAVRKQRARCEKNLTAQHQELAVLKEENNRIWEEVDKLREFNIHTRKTCSGLEDTNARLREELVSMKANISLAQEFLRTSLAAVDNMTDLRSDTFAVLAEFEEQDAREEREKRLQQIDVGADMGLLQIKARARKPDSVEESSNLLQALLHSMQSWHEQQNKSEIALQVAFEAEFQKGEDNRAALRKDQMTANETRTSLLEVKEQLIVAQAQLAKTRDRLIKNTHALRSFAQRLGNAVHADEEKPHADKDARVAKAHGYVSSAGEEEDEEEAMKPSSSRKPAADKHVSKAVRKTSKGSKQDA